MKLYHGSNVTVEKPKIIKSKRNLDFGNGFYLTSDLDQAIKWSFTTTMRRKKGNKSVSVYNYNENNNLKILKFDSPNTEWLHFVSLNRKRLYEENNYDIIIGPVANDNTMPVINDYLNNVYNEEEAIKRLLTQNLKDQIVFKTEKALAYLVFEEVKIYE